MVRATETRSIVRRSMSILKRDVCTEGSLVDERAQKRKDEIPIKQQEAPSPANNRGNTNSERVLHTGGDEKKNRVINIRCGVGEISLGSGLHSIVVWDLSRTSQADSASAFGRVPFGYEIGLSQKCMNDQTTRYIFIDEI